MERMVLVPDSAQYKRPNVCLVGPIQTLLQPSGITEWKKRSLKWFIPFFHLSQALADCVQDLLRPFHDDTIDLVAGIDAMGFILGKMATERERERDPSGR